MPFGNRCLVGHIRHDVLDLGDAASVAVQAHLLTVTALDLAPVVVALVDAPALQPHSANTARARVLGTALTVGEAMVVTDPSVRAHRNRLDATQIVVPDPETTVVLVVKDADRPPHHLETRNSCSNQHDVTFKSIR